MPINPIYVGVENDSSENGAGVSYMSMSSAGKGKMKLVCNKDGTYSILTPSTDYSSALSVSDTSSEKPIQQWEYVGGDNQKFVLEPVIPEPVRLDGDINRDGAMNVADLVLLQKFILGAEKELPDWKAGDFNEDGRLDTFDLIQMRQWLVDRA